MQCMWQGCGLQHLQLRSYVVYGEKVHVLLTEFCVSVERQSRCLPMAFNVKKSTADPKSEGASFGVFHDAIFVHGVKKTAYLTLVRVLDCAPVWSPNQAKDKKILEGIQKRTTHWICFKWNPHNHSWGKSYAEELKELGWELISQTWIQQIPYTLPDLQNHPFT